MGEATLAAPPFRSRSSADAFRTVHRASAFTRRVVPITTSWALRPRAHLRTIEFSTPLYREANDVVSIRLFYSYLVTISSLCERAGKEEVARALGAQASALPWGVAAETKHGKKKSTKKYP